MTSILTFEQWRAIDIAWQDCCSVPSSKVKPLFIALHRILLDLNLTSIETDTYSELADIARYWLSTHYIADLAPRPDAKRLWQHWKQMYGEHLERYMSQDFTECLTERAGYIYVLKMGSWYKIGRAQHVIKRFPQISVRLPLPTRLWMIFFSADMYENETRMHDYYSEFHTNGEWFNIPDSEATRLYAAQPHLDAYWLPTIGGPPWRQTDLASSIGLYHV